jgi:hypothetical protein
MVIGNNVYLFYFFRLSFTPQHQAQKLAGALASNFFATMGVWEIRLDPNILVEVVKVAKIQVCARIF